MVTTERRSSSLSARWPLVVCLALVLACARVGRGAVTVLRNRRLRHEPVRPGQRVRARGRRRHAAGLHAESAAHSQCTVREGRPPLQQRRDVGRAVCEVRWSGRQRPAGLGDDGSGSHQLCGGRRQGLRRRHQLQPDAAGGHVPPALRRRRIVPGSLRHRDGQQRHPRCLPALCDRRQRRSHPDASARFDCREYPEAVRGRRERVSRLGGAERRADARDSLASPSRTGPGCIPDAGVQRQSRRDSGAVVSRPSWRQLSRGSMPINS